ncbi:MAG: dihydroorotase [Treponema sp.]
MIDVHVHFRDGSQCEKETIKHGFSVAYKAGVLSCFDMPNTVPPLTTKKDILARLEFGQKMVEEVDQKAIYRIYVGLTNDIEQIRDMVQIYNELFPRVVGFKMFAGHSTGNMGILEKDMQRTVYNTLVDCGYKGVIAVHCEKTQEMKEELFDISKPETHSLARPIIAEVESIKDQIDLVRETGFKGHLHICHISTKDGVVIVKKAKEECIDISSGATAHHALLNDEAYKTQRLFAKMNPPLRNEENRKAIFSALISGDIDWIESDHAPHTIKDKEAGASGIPGFAGTLLLIQHLRKAGVSEEKLNALCGENANKVFALNLPVSVPSNERINEVLPEIRKAYPFDAFSRVE